MSVIISPETRLEALFEAYPELEDYLVAAVPAFTNLKNPVLRKSVVRVATVEQVARMGGVGARELVTRLRQAAGQPPVEPPVPSSSGCGGGCGHGDAAPANAGPAPAWLAEERIRVEIDADAMLETGEHPIGKVRQSVANLRTGEIVRLTSSFRPAPLIETMARGGVAVYSAETSPGRHATYFCRP